MARDGWTIRFPTVCTGCSCGEVRPVRTFEQLSCPSSRNALFLDTEFRGTTAESRGSMPTRLEARATAQRPRPQGWPSGQEARGQETRGQGRGVPKGAGAQTEERDHPRRFVSGAREGGTRWTAQDAKLIPRPRRPRRRGDEAAAQGRRLLRRPLPGKPMTNAAVKRRAPPR